MSLWSSPLPQLDGSDSTSGIVASVASDCLPICASSGAESLGSGPAGVDIYTATLGGIAPSETVGASTDEMQCRITEENSRNRLVR